MEKKEPLKPQMSYGQSCQLRTIHQFGGVKIADIIKDRKRSPGFVPFPSAMIYRHAKLPLDGRDEFEFDKHHQNKGRPSKLTLQDRRSIIRQVGILRKQDGLFTSRKVQMYSLENKVSNSTIRRVLHAYGCGYRRTRKKDC